MTKTNEEIILDILKEFVKRPDTNPKTVELAYILINDRDYIPSFMSLFSNLAYNHPIILNMLVEVLLRMKLLAITGKDEFEK